VPAVVQNPSVPEPTAFDALAANDHELSPDECAELARSAARLVDVAALERSGGGSATRLWLNEWSEGWLNTWWEMRDTGFHDHGASCVGVYVLEGRARSEALVVAGRRRRLDFDAGTTFTLERSGIHRVEHERGTVTIHVYAPPLREIGHYDVVDGELHRHAGPADETSPPSPALVASLETSG
jgi:Cysteine dioxygenase type I